MIKTILKLVLVINVSLLTLQERLEAAGGENQTVAVVATIDDDGAPADAETVVACPLCKLNHFYVAKFYCVVV